MTIRSLPSQGFALVASVLALAAPTFAQETPGDTAGKILGGAIDGGTNAAGTPPAPPSGLDTLLSMSAAQAGVTFVIALIAAWVFGWLIFRGALEGSGPRKAGRIGLAVGVIIFLLIVLVPPFAMGKTVGELLVADPPNAAPSAPGTPAPTPSTAGGEEF